MAISDLLGANLHAVEGVEFGLWLQQWLLAGANDRTGVDGVTEDAGANGDTKIGIMQKERVI